MESDTFSEQGNWHGSSADCREPEMVEELSATKWLVNRRESGSITAGNPLGSSGCSR